MKRKISMIVTAITLAAMLLLTLCACGGSTWGKIKSAYEKEGYHEVQLSDELKKALNLDQIKEGDVKVTIHVMSNAKEDNALSLLAGKTAVIMEYKNVNDMKKYMKDQYGENGEKSFEEFWEETQKSDNVNGNCVYMGLADSIFKGTK